MFKLDLEKAEKPEIKLPTDAGSSKKQESSRKTSTSALLTTPKPLTAWIRTDCGKFWKRWEYQTTWSASWEICMQVKKQQLELDMRQQTGSKSGKESMKAVYCHPAYLTYMQGTSWKWQLTPVILPGEFHGQRSLVGYIQSMGLQRVRHDRMTFIFTFSRVCAISCNKCFIFYILIHSFMCSFNKYSLSTYLKPVTGE